MMMILQKVAPHLESHAGIYLRLRQEVHRGLCLGSLD